MTNRSINRPTRRLLAPLVALGLLTAACGSDTTSSETTNDRPTSSDTASTPDGPKIRLRGQDFSESITLTEVYGQFLAARGYDVEILPAAGFRTEAFDGLDNGQFDVIIEYIGGVQSAIAPDATPSADPSAVVATIEPLLTERGLTLLDASAAVDGDALVVRGDSEANAISDLVGMNYRFGASAQCPERPQCLIGLESPDVYGIEFASYTTIEYGPLLGEALAANEVDAVIWNTTAPQITEKGFKALDDDKGLFPAQNIAPIIVTAVLEAYGGRLADDLNELSALITTDDLLAWNTSTDLELRESDDVARDWLSAKGLI